MNTELATLIIEWYKNKALKVIEIYETEYLYDECGDFKTTEDSVLNQNGELKNINSIIEKYSLSAEGNVLARMDCDINNQDDDSAIAKELIDKYNNDNDLYLIEVMNSEDELSYIFFIQ